MKKILFVGLIFSALAAAFVYGKIRSEQANFKQAEDFPRAALFYVQIQDLPAFIELWNESEIRRKYLESANFDDFQNNHLALKLAERAGEISAAIGIFPDPGFISALSDNRAAFAVYDIGKMEFVFIAPLSEEKALLSRLFELRSNFEEIRLDDGTVVYAREIEIDRARQRQKILFAHLRGRLILASGEKHFLQTLENIKGKTPKNRLSADPLFKQVAEKTTPHLATVWLNQEKLNDDWYFKNYWLMSKTKTLKIFRSGMADFEIQDEKVIERRVFLTTGNKAAGKIKAETASRLRRLIPESVPFYQLEAAGKFDFGETLSETLFDAKNDFQSARSSPARKNYDFQDWGKSYSYKYLGSGFGERIDEIEDEIPPGQTAEKTFAGLSEIIGAASPNASLKLFLPGILPAPLFFETRKALIFSLQNPANLNRNALENALSGRARKLLTVNDRNRDFIWTDLSAENFRARQMALPSLGWKIFYTVRQNELIFANSEELLREILAPRENLPGLTESFENLTVINLENGRGAFYDVFQILENRAENSAYEKESRLFTKNIGSLFDVISDVERIEIRQRSSAQNFLFEEIDFVLKDKRR